MSVPGPSGAAAPSPAGPPPTPPALTPAELDDNPRRQKILICGDRRSGKTSILKVLFHGISPRDTFRFIPPTHETRVENVEVFAPFQIWDVPGTKDLRLSPDELKKFAAMIWVVDAINNYDDLFEQIASAFCTAYAANPQIKLFVFVHKADGLTTDAAQDAFKDLQTEISNEIPYHLSPSAEPDDIPQPAFYLSSIYTYLLPLAFSQVILRILPPAPYLAGLLDSFVTASSVFKSFLVDRGTRVFVATDTAPVQDSIFNVLQEWVKKMGAYERLFDPVLSRQAVEPSQKALEAGLFPSPGSLKGAASEAAAANGVDEGEGSSVPVQEGEEVEYEPLSDEEDGEETGSSDGEDGSEESDEDDGEDAPGSEANEDGDEDDAPPPPGHGKGNGNRVPRQEVHLSSGLTLVYWEMTPKLALVGIIRTEHYRSYRPRIDDGVRAVRRAVRKYVELASGRGAT